jgi:hypothetical protein
MKRIIALASAFILVSALACATETVINAYDFANQAAVDAAFTTGGNDISTNTAEVLISPETSIKTQGTSSLKVEYRSSGIRWYECFFRQSLTTPLNMGDYRKFKIDMYCASSTFSSLHVPYVVFYSNSGNSYRKVFWPADYPLVQGWNTITLDIGDMTINPWQGFSNGNGCNLSNITTVDFYIQNTLNTAGSNTALNTTPKVTTIVYIDNFRGYNKSDRTSSVIMNDMEYASFDAMTAAGWVSFSTTTNRTVAYAPVTGSYNSSKTLQMDFSIPLRWYNVGINSPNYATPLDLSQAKYIKMWFKGSVSNQTTSGPLFQWFFRDTTGQRAAARVASASIINGDWQSMTWPIPGESGKASLWEDAWDGAVGADSTLKRGCVQGNMFWAQTGAENGTNNFSVYIDDLEYGYTDSNLFLTCNVSDIYAAPNSAAVTLTAGGVGPFTWSISSSLIGTLSASSGSSITFNPGATVANGNIVLHDDTGESITIPVYITPTSAPLAKDWALME